MLHSISENVNTRYGVSVVVYKQPITIQLSTTKQNNNIAFTSLFGKQKL